MGSGGHSKSIVSFLYINFSWLDLGVWLHCAKVGSLNPYSGDSGSPFRDRWVTGAFKLQRGRSLARGSFFFFIWIQLPQTLVCLWWGQAQLRACLASASSSEESKGRCFLEGKLYWSARNSITLDSPARSVWPEHCAHLMAGSSVWSAQRCSVSCCPLTFRANQFWRCLVSRPKLILKHSTTRSWKWLFLEHAHIHTHRHTHTHTCMWTISCSVFRTVS